MVTRQTKKQTENDRCALYSEHLTLKNDLEQTKNMTIENRELIQSNHIEAMKVIADMSKAHTEEFGKIVGAIQVANEKFDMLNITVKRAGRLFEWWDSLPCKMRMIAKVLSFIVAAMGGATVIINFFEKILGN